MKFITLMCSMFFMCNLAQANQPHKCEVQKEPGTYSFSSTLMPNFAELNLSLDINNATPDLKKVLMMHIFSDVTQRGYGADILEITASSRDCETRLLDSLFEQTRNWNIRNSINKEYTQAIDTEGRASPRVMRLQTRLDEHHTHHGDDRLKIPSGCSLTIEANRYNYTTIDNVVCSAIN